MSEPRKRTPLEQRVDRELIKALVQRAITCPVSGSVLDVRTCVVFRDADGDPSAVVSQAGYVTLRDEHPDRLEALAASGHTVDTATIKEKK